MFGRTPLVPSGRGSLRVPATAIARVRSVNPTAAAMEAARSGTSAAAAEAEDREQEGGEEDLQPDDDQRRGEQREPLLAQRAEPAAQPLDEDHRGHREPGEGHRAAEEEPVFELEARAHPVEP